MIRVIDTFFDPEAELLKFRQSQSKAGAIVSFVGIVREDNQTEVLTLSHYPGFTEARIEQFLSAAIERWSLLGAIIIHRVGRMVPGEPIVFVATASAHRRSAFEACDHLMDMLKSEAPFWKSETKAGKTEWIEPRAQDAHDLKRWEE